MQDRGQIVFTNDARDEPMSTPIATEKLSAADLLDAAKSGFEYRATAADATSILIRKRNQPVLRIDPTALESADMLIFAKAFKLARDRSSFDITIERLDPFLPDAKAGSVATIDLETRSLLQVLYFASKGVNVPAIHTDRGFVQQSTYPTGSPFDWRILTRKLIEVQSNCLQQPPGELAFIDRRDHQSLATFSLIQEVARLETSARPGTAPILTLPLNGR